MHELTTNLEPGNPDGHTVLRYLVEAKQMPLDVAIERVYKAVGKYAAEYRSDQNKLLTGMLVTGVLGLPVFFPFGVPSLLIAGSIGASVVSWQELGAMRDRLKPELACLKNSVLLEQFIKWLAEEVKKRRGQSFDSPTTPFQADAITTANILTAYEHTVFCVAQGEHLENNASDPILALFVVKLRQHTNHLPNWVMDAFRHLEQAEAQRSSHLEAAYGYMFGNLSQSPVGQNTRLGAVDVPAQSVEGENRLGKSIEISSYSLPPSHFPSQPAVPTPETNTSTPAVTNIKWIDNFVSQTALIWGNQGSGKSWMARYIAKRKKDKGYRVVVLDPDSNRAEWEGVESYHDFEEIADFLRWYVDELMSRYKAFNASTMTEDAWRAKLWAERKAIALICEEVTTYVDLIEDKKLLTQFFRLGLTKSRKQEMPLTFVSHNNNQTALGGIQGLANLIDKMLQLELQTDIDPDTLQPTASGKGAVKLDGSNQWVPVTLPKLEQKITNFGELQPTVVQPVNVTETIANTQLEEEAITSTEITNELKISDSLAEPLKSIWLFAKKKNDWVTARDVYNNGMSVLKGKGVKQIRQYFGLLADSGFGEIDEQDGDKPKSDSSVGFRAN
ncbi:MAG: ATP-binding protein [Symplocastrum torsivum CPER-KK1]|uniref:ATP-binding protein n=1 Tax=Symplocastrum torsivum CPER-KK1 TaxID=450513 RepID=A0A951PSZ9_9CYAN|nr:ATP-binding protein [Symplocastrum torsivum CPER-KK1]